MISLASFERLQVLSLQKFALESPTISQNVIDKIAKCRHLGVIDIVLHEFNDVETVLDIARGWPLTSEDEQRAQGSGTGCQ